MHFGIIIPVSFATELLSPFKISINNTHEEVRKRCANPERIFIAGQLSHA